ncbi:DUF6090 family protein [Chryseobacterium suipulveris]|uniref:DUF6090 family protein n=1 Tax=Chryseobacterium suipulveris TaxID=2929800 RepID=A0ABY4BNA4_9FLAO|nr:DUF6090 family protein [Chryseobacterium suipulveris]UOE39722.1 DUF6090 family protein [Chryseobacterium suipulveris]
MAELEVAKSTKKIFTTAKSKEHSLWEKIKKIGMEVAIIVFAVSLSIGLHSWSEARHEQNEVKVFLEGLRNDLQKDRQEMLGDIEAYENQKKAFNYLSQIPKGTQADSDSINAHSKYFYSFTGYGGNTGRYEGFKSSGKIGYIENDSLLNNILDLYEEKIPILTISTDFYKNQKIRFAEYITENTVDYPEGNLTQVLASDPVKNRSNIYLSSVNQIIDNYRKCVSKIDIIIEQIDKEHPKKH